MSEVKRYAPFDGYMFPITTRHGYVRTDDYDALASKLRESERIAADRNRVIGELGQRVAELEAALIRANGTVNVDHVARAERDQCMRELRDLRAANEWVPFKPGDPLPPSGAYLVCTKYNTGRPRDPFARIQGVRHTDDAKAWSNYTVAYWGIRLPDNYVPPKQEGG